MKKLKICLVILCLLHVSAVGMPRFSGAVFFMKEIKLTKGMVTLVDDEDFEYLNRWKWFAHHRRAGKFYAARNSTYVSGQKRHCVSMHRVILNITDKKVFADHKDGNSLNNQKYNLRLSTYLQNNANSKARKNSSSKYLGVSLQPNGRWLANIQCNKKAHRLGL